VTAPAPNHSWSCRFSAEAQHGRHCGVRLIRGLFGSRPNILLLAPIDNPLHRGSFALKEYSMLVSNPLPARYFIPGAIDGQSGLSTMRSSFRLHVQLRCARAGKTFSCRIGSQRRRLVRYHRDGLCRYTATRYPVAPPDEVVHGTSRLRKHCTTIAPELPVERTHCGALSYSQHECFRFHFTHLRVFSAIFCTWHCTMPVKGERHHSQSSSPGTTRDE
jgi:hypothetical protein